MNPQLVRLRARIGELNETLTAITESATAEERDLTDAEQRNVADHEAELTAALDRAEQLERIEQRMAAAAALAAQTDEAVAAAPEQRAAATSRPGRVAGVRDPLVYRPDGEHDFVVDMLRSLVLADPEAQARQAQHMIQMRDTTTTGLGAPGGLVPPTFLVDLYAPVLHEARPFADSLRREALNGRSVTSIPVGTQGTDADIQDTGTEGGSLDNQDITATDIDIPTRTIGGYVDVTRQSVDLGTLSPQMVYSDLFAKVGRRLDLQVLSGTGLNGQIKGVLSTTAVPDITADGNAYDDVWRAITDAKVSVRQSFAGPATHVAFNSERWGWIQSQLDSEGRPILAMPGSFPQNVGGDAASMNDGTFNGLRVVVDDNIADPETAIVYNARELWLWEDAGGQPRTITAEQVRAHQLVIRLVAWTYAAFTVERYPGAAAIVTLGELS